MLYCTTAPLDGYVMLPDRTPCTRMMMSHSICTKDFCDPWYTHPKKYYLPSVHLLLSGYVSVQIGSIRAAHHGQSMPLAIVHGSRNLGLTCGTYHCGENMEDVVEEMDNRILKETECHSETIEVPHMKGVLSSLIWLGLIYPPFWFSMLESKKGYTHITGRK